MQIRLIYRNLCLSYKYMLISFIICRSRGDAETASFSLEIAETASFALEIPLQTLKLPTFSRTAIWVIVMYTPVAKEQRDTMFYAPRCFLLKCSHFSYCVEVGGMWERLVFPRDPSTSIQNELV